MRHGGEFKVSNYMKYQLHGLDCLIPNICNDSNQLQNYWIIAQEKSQGDMKDYPESWLLDAKAIIDLGHYGVKILRPKGHIIGSNESLLALKNLQPAKPILLLEPGLIFIHYHQ